MAANSVALRPSHEADRLILAAEQAFDNGSPQRAAEHLEKARQLGISLPPEYDYFYGKLLIQRGDTSDARRHLERYADTVGRDGEHYRDALKLITKADGNTRAAPSNKKMGEEKSEIAWSDGSAQYIAKIEQLHGTGSSRDALNGHINNLLRFYAYDTSNIVAASRLGTTSNHKLSTTQSGDVISINRFGNKEKQRYDEDRFSVYGVNPYIEYKCTSATNSCWLYHPVSGDRWLQIVNNQEIAEELAKAVTNLIRQMQKSNS
ncbi:hypothetical protein [Aurantivibrio plasticivorans]